MIKLSIGGSAMTARQQPETDALLRKIAWRLIPFMGLLFFVAFLDRVNVSYAALTMNEDIGLTAAAYGLGAGIFFIGYFIFEIPSNLILKKVGARKWIARIMISWGFISGATAFVEGPTSFYIIRFLLGAAEAGFFPGMILYLTYWFPGRVRGKILGLFLMAVPLSTVIGAPVSTALLDVSIFGLAGWQTMFIVEAVPAIVLGVVVAFWLTDNPAKAKWLTAEERDHLEALLSEDHRQMSQVSDLKRGLLGPEVWGFSFIYLTLVLGLYGLNFWVPQIIKAFGGLSNQQVGFLSAAPYLVAALAMNLWGRHSDRKGERVWHISLTCLVAAVGFALAAQTAEPSVRLIALTAAAAGILSTIAVFWTLPTSLLSGSAAAGGIALINSVGNLGGYFGPFLMGWLREATGDYSAGLFLLSGTLAVGGLFIHTMRPMLRRKMAGALH